MKHTPGPWHVEPGDNLVCPKINWDRRAFGDFGQGMQISVSLQQGEKQAHVDALLVAAAPTLLGVLERIADPKVRALMTDDDWAMVTQVCAKARGAL